jgi:hypothetical protein
MKSPSIASRILMIFLLAIGILIGTALVGIATWGDFFRLRLPTKDCQTSDARS